MVPCRRVLQRMGVFLIAIVTAPASILLMMFLLNPASPGFAAPSLAANEAPAVTVGAGAPVRATTVTTTPVAGSLYLPAVLRKWFATGPHLPLAYGPYRHGQAPGGTPPSRDEIESDMALLAAETRLLRSYESCDEWATVTAVASSHGIHLYQGVALSADLAANERQLACFETLRHQYPDTIAAAVVGNETLLRGELTATQIDGYVKRVKQMGAGDVSTAETWDVWCDLHDQIPRCPGVAHLPDSVDFITAHIYPYWETIPVTHAAAHVIATQIFMRTVFTDTEIVVGETGWPTCGAINGSAVPGIENQRAFIEALWKWSNLYAIRVLNFEAFDEDWKATVEGEVGRCWGLSTADRTPKHAGLDWTAPVPDAIPPTATVQIDHPDGNSATVAKANCAIPIFGKVYHAQPGWKVRVEVYTNAWYRQDKWYADGEAPIVDGQWAVPEVILAGQGQYNNHKIRATVVDETGSPVGNPAVSAEIDGIVRTNACTP